MKITNGKDFWAGLMFVAFGLAFMIVAQNYSMGTAVRMGPAYFPTVLGGLLAVLGGFILFNGFISRHAHPWKVFPFRAWYFIAGLLLGAVAYYTQAWFHSLGIAGDGAHTILAGAAILLLFATFGETSLWIVLFAVVIFGYLLKPLGLVVAVFAMTIVSAVPGFTWTRKDFQMLPIYAAAGLLLTYLTLLVSVWIQRAVIAAFGAVGLNFPHVLALLFAEIGLGGVLAFIAGRRKWPQITAAHVTVLSFILAVFSVASFVDGLGLPMYVWPSLWE
jgi:hypothetical protein